MTILLPVWRFWPIGVQKSSEKRPWRYPRSCDMGTFGKNGVPYWGSRRCPRRLRSRRVWRSIQQNKRLRFIGFGQPLYLGAGGQFESENISGYVARRVTKISGIVAGDEPGPCTEGFRPLTRGICGGRGEVETLSPNISPW